MIELYRGLATTRIKPPYDEQIDALTNILTQVDNEFTHPCFTMIQLNIHTEVSVLLGLLTTNSYLGNFDFKESIFSMHECKLELSTWKNVYENPTDSSVTKDPTRLKVLKSGLYFWLDIFMQVTVSKMALYFHNIFAKKEALFGGNMKQITSNLSINYPF
eukprot:TRINITY_DN4730_c0_g1_i1.p1 TRINITY_DN4730_c0_g1~~TRINITY_DN4730_c0_g1_i1.p1  ORF type:complete len:160 (-),score=22.17 TRINITY_DN4730_c0_g1_i1:484-963(-)